MDDNIYTPSRAVEISREVIIDGPSLNAKLFL